MAADIAILQERLDQLQHLSGSLSVRLESEAVQLEQTGTPPTASLIADLTSLQEQTDQLYALMGEEGTNGPWHTCDDLAAEIDRQQAITPIHQLIERILLIQGIDEASQSAIAALHDEARQVAAAPTSFWTPEQIQSVQTGQHPWMTLVTLLEDGATLDDTAWTALNTRLESSLGRAVSVAAARGRLKFREAIKSIHLADTSFPTILNDSLISAWTTQTTPPSSDELALIEDHVAVPFPAPEVQLPSLPDNASVRTFERSVIALRATDQLASTDLDNLSGEILDHPTLAFVRPEVRTQELSTSVLDDWSEDLVPLRNPDRNPAAASTKTPLSTIPDSVIPSVHQNHDRISRGPDNRIAPESINKSIFDDDDSDYLPGMLGSTDPRSPGAARSLESFQPSRLAEYLLTQARFSDPSGATANLAAEILNNPEANRTTLLPDLILHLIHEGRPGLAYHLARGLEERTQESKNFVPSWLVRVWTFAHALLFPKGQLAGMIQDDLQQHESRIPRKTQSDWDLALSLMIRAATLRPAIVAPMTRAASTLRAFDLRDGCVQLYNYCSRIGSYGERIQGVYPGLFKQSTVATPYSEQWSALRDDVRNWLDDPTSVGIQFDLCAPLFQKAHWSLRSAGMQRSPEAADTWKNWQIALRHAKSIIDPVIANHRPDLNRVRSEVEEISGMLAAPVEDADARESFSQPEIRAYLRQALTFAQRWITLHQRAANSETQNYLPQTAVELRSEIESRHDAVMEELQVLASSYPAVEVRMAVACLMLSAQEIRDMVNPTKPAESVERDPRHILHSELLKITSINLNSNWEPELDFHNLEDEILNYLSQPQPDWTTALKLHLSQGNHSAADRILSMSLWSAEEREALQAVLVNDRDRKRTEFSEDVNYVRRLLNETIQLNAIPDSERVVFQTRLSKLERVLESDADLSTGLQELNRLRSGLLKQREREAERIRNRLRQLGRPPAPSERDETQSESPAPKGWIMDFEN